jgi:hypothetical protein
MDILHWQLSNFNTREVVNLFVCLLICSLSFSSEPFIFFISHLKKNEVWTIIILPITLYGCVTRYFILEGRLMIFENRVLRRVFGSKKGRRSNRRLERNT